MNKLLLTIIALNMTFMAYADGTYSLAGVDYYYKITKNTTSTKSYGEVTITGGKSTGGKAFEIDMVKVGDYYYKVTAIDPSAFKDATWIESVKISTYTASVGDDAFRGCTAMKNVSMNQNNSFGKRVFYGCTALTSVYFPQGITAIPEKMFYGCTALTTITIGRDVETMADDAFSGCSNITSLSIASNFITSQDYNELRNMSTLFGNGVTSINLNPSGSRVSRIGAYAFYSSKNLRKVEFPESLSTIANRAFYRCEKLVQATLPEHITSIGAYAFAYCSAMGDMTIPASVTSIGEYILFEASKYSSSTLTIKCNVKNEAFMRLCYSYIVLDEEITSFEIGSFSSPFSDLLELTINSDAVLNKTYTQSNNLFTATVASSGSSYQSYYYTYLKKVVIGGNVKTIGAYAFSQDGNNYVADVNNDFVDLQIGEGVTTINAYAFFQQNSLTSITFPSTVTTVNQWAFAECLNAQKVNFPPSLTKIGFHAFSSCPKINTIKAEANIPYESFEEQMYISSVNKETCDVYAFSQEIYNAYRKYGFKKVYLIGGSGTKEDVNGDGEVNSLDVLKVYKYMQAH